MLLLALLAEITTHEDHNVTWHCTNVASKQAFVLIYEQRRDLISNVRIWVPGTPRLWSDASTRWRAKPSADGLEFSFYNKVTGHSGVMSLIRAHQTEQSRLRWRDVVGIGSHIPLENEEQLADCQLR